MAAKPITWHSETIKVVDLIENPNNPKKPDAKGRKRLLKSIQKFGVVTGGVCNLDNMLIDGHSRKDVFLELGIDEVQVQKPSRKLTPAEYKDFNAVFDLAKAGETDMAMMEEMFNEKFFDEWDIGKNLKKMKEDSQAKYPIVAEFDETFEAVIIVCTTATDLSFVKNALLLGKQRSYKNKNTGETFVLTAKQFIELWESESK